MTGRPTHGERPRTRQALRPPGAELKASEARSKPSQDARPANRFPLRVFTEPLPLFLGLCSTPLPISWQVSADGAGNLCPAISEKTMTGDGGARPEAPPTEITSASRSSKPQRIPALMAEAWTTGGPRAGQLLPDFVLRSGRPGISYGKPAEQPSATFPRSPRIILLCKT